MSKYDLNELKRHKDCIGLSCKNIQGSVLKTPCLHSAWLSEETGCKVHLKMESEQLTGAFKIRGATNKLNNLLFSGEVPKQLVTASEGNHALACASIAQCLNIPLNVFSTVGLSEAKETRLKMYSNVTLDKSSINMGEAHTCAHKMSLQRGIPFLSSYNDWDVVYGQASIGVELLDQLPALDVVFVPVGGGGMISGIALHLKSQRPEIRVVGLQASNYAFIYHSVQAGHVLRSCEHKPTIALGGPIAEGSITFDICQKYVDEWVLPEEEEIERALVDLLKRESKLVEPAAALTIAGLRKVQRHYQGKTVALVMSGGNVAVGQLTSLLSKYQE